MLQLYCPLTPTHQAARAKRAHHVSCSANQRIRWATLRCLATTNCVRILMSYQNLENVPDIAARAPPTACCSVAMTTTATVVNLRQPSVEPSSSRAPAERRFRRRTPCQRHVAVERAQAAAQRNRHLVYES